MGVGFEAAGPQLLDDVRDLVDLAGVHLEQCGDRVAVTDAAVVADGVLQLHRSDRPGGWAAVILDFLRMPRPR